MNVIYCGEEQNLQNEKIVYHYTSPEAFCSIIKSNNFHFTDCQYLNDMSEYKYILKPLFAAIDELSSFMDVDGMKEQFERFFDEYETQKYISLTPMTDIKNYKVIPIRMRYFVFCTSENFDSLVMWNYYIKNNKYQGYNMGIDVNKFVEDFRKIGDNNLTLLHGKVIYDITEQVNILKREILKIEEVKQTKIKEAKEEADVDIAISEQDYEYRFMFEKYSLFFKDPAFLQENEYRFVIQTPLDKKYIEKMLDFDFEVRNGIIVPYCICKFNPCSLRKITVSPLLDNDLIKNSVMRFLKKTNIYEDVELTKSSIPVRY